MDMSFCSPLQLQDASSFLFDCNTLLHKSCDALGFDPSSDPGYFSACSSLSPTSSVDSFSFSPNTPQVKTEQEPLDCVIFSCSSQEMTTTAKTLPASTASTTKKSRSRYPGKKRQTASEREKLRMRDLTKALHHLRSYLPASVVPVGQTLTKIETLRLTIRYMSYLAAQLGLTEEVLKQRSSGRVEKPSALSVEEPLFTYSPLKETLYSSSLHPAGPNAYSASVMVSDGHCYSTQQYWGPQEQYLHMGFNGQC